MKPKDLKRLFTFENRRPYLEDHIFHLPVFYCDYAEFSLPSFNHYFGNENPLSIEFCSGNGDWIVEKAKNDPSKNWIAVEKRFDRVKKIWSKLKNGNIANLLIVFGMAETFVQHYVPSNCLDEVYIHFPDPWPKMRHAKNRLIQPPFLNQLARVLKEGKKITIVSDDLPFITQTVSVFANHSRFAAVFSSPYYQIEAFDYGNSWFEKFLREQGKPIHTTQFVRHETAS